MGGEERKLFQVQQSKCQPDFITVCQITARLHTSSPAAFPNSLSGTTFKIHTPIFYLRYLSIFYSQPVVQFCVRLSTNQITFPSASKLSEQVFPSLDWRALWPSVISKQLKLQSQSKFAGEHQHISFPLCHIKFSIWHHAMREGERESTPASVTRPHHRHTNISSVQLLSTPGWISLIMKHYRASLSTETNHWAVCQKGSWP